MGRAEHKNDVTIMMTTARFTLQYFVVGIKFFLEHFILPFLRSIFKRRVCDEEL